MIVQREKTGWRCCPFILDEDGRKWFLWENGEYYREPP
jgi:hypothetical protein